METPLLNITQMKLWSDTCFGLQVKLLDCKYSCVQKIHVGNPLQQQIFVSFQLNYFFVIHLIDKLKQTCRTKWLVVRLTWDFGVITKDFFLNTFLLFLLRNLLVLPRKEDSICLVGGMCKWEPRYMSGSALPLIS